MKNWLKKVKNNEIIDMLEDKSSKKKIYSVPKSLDEEVRFNLKKISKEIKSKKEKRNIFFTPKLAFGYSFLALVIVGFFLFYSQKGSIPNYFKMKKLNQCLVTLIEGDVYLVDENYKNISEIKIGLNIGEKDIIKTGKASTLELQIGDDSLIRVKEKSIVKIAKLFKNQEIEETKINLDIGKILVKPQNLTEGSSFEIDTKSVTAGVRGTEFTVTKSEEGVSRIAVSEGEVSVKKNITSKEIKKIRKIDKELANDLNRVLHKEVVVKKDEKIEISDHEYNNFKDHSLRVIKHISEDLENNQKVKAELEDLLKAIKETAVIELEEGGDRVIFKDRVTSREWREDFNRGELEEMRPVGLEQEFIEKKEQKEPPEIYKFDFEREPEHPFVDSEWEIIPDKNNNRVFAPIHADKNSDSFFEVRPAKNLILQFRFKRFPNRENVCWMAIDLGKSYDFSEKGNDWLIFDNNKIIFTNRHEEKEYTTGNYNFEFGKWYNFKLVIKDGNYFNIYINDNKIIEYKKEESVEYCFIKLEGNPTEGMWYLDDFYFEGRKELPRIYKNDFEDNSNELFSTNEMGEKEWGIILDSENNHVFVPIQARANSDAFIDIKETENFILQFRFKRFPNKDKACWIAIDLGINKGNRFFNKENDWIILANDEIRFRSRLNEREYKTIKYNFEFNKWYNFKIIVESGKRFDIYIDNRLVLTYNKLKKDIFKFNYIKFEGHPTMGKWYLDDIYYEAK